MEKQFIRGEGEKVQYADRGKRGKISTGQIVTGVRGRNGFPWSEHKLSYENGDSRKKFWEEIGFVAHTRAYGVKL